jgi:hypothetical protein
MFHLGQKVVSAVSDRQWIRDGIEAFFAYRGNAELPRRERVYTVAGVIPFADRAYLRLAELPADTAYLAQSFRPVAGSRTTLARVADLPIWFRPERTLRQAHLEGA